VTDAEVPRPGAGDRSAGVPSGASCTIWWATPREDTALTGLLDDAERQRSVRLARSEDRSRFVTAHALVRLLLAARTGIPPAELRFDRTCRRCGGDHGKPRLADDTPLPTGPPPFNLAHAAARIAVAVADVTGPDGGFDVGVDVERVPPAGDSVLATAGPEILTAAELAAYRQLDTSGRGRALAVWWTRKEAVLKATGDGLAVPPSSIGVTAPDEPPAVTGWTVPARERRLDTGERDTAPGRLLVVLRDLQAADGYVGCVAVVGAASLTVTEHDADPLLAAR
jgi:4'-phosphopantetheinyl transferase